MVWHKLTGLFLAYNIRAQHRPVHTALTHNLRRIGNPIFLCFLAVSPSAPEVFIITDSPSPYFFIERLGRRKMLISSSAACCFCMIMISSMLAMNTTTVGPATFPS